MQAPATAIAELYKARWEIERLFKWIKQNLRVKHFLGSSRNAITLQILAALIAFLLVRIAQLRNQPSLAAQAAYRLISATLLERRALFQLMLPDRTKADRDSTTLLGCPAWLIRTPVAQGRS